MDPAETIKTAGLAQQEIIGAPDASQIFQTKRDSLFKVTTNLSPDQEELVKKIAGFPILVKGGVTVTNDHPVLVALRELIRHAHESSFKIASTSLKTLMVGATYREYSKYNNNKHIHYYYAGKDSKDVSRFILPVLNNLTKTLESKIVKYDRKSILDKQQLQSKENILKRYNNITALIKDLQGITPKLPTNIHTKIPDENFAALDFQDSIYNFTFNDIYQIMETTGALTATGYAFLPLELLFPDMPKSSLYTIRHEGDTTYFNFRNGVCAGYNHKTKNVLSLFKQQTFVGKNFSLVSSIEGRIGPFVFFRINRTTSAEKVNRVIELPDDQKFVRVLDIPGSVDLRTGKIWKPLKYFSVNLDEYLALHNYAYGINPESVTIPNLVAFIRNRIDGASLVTKQLVSPWHLDHMDIYKLAFNVYLYFHIMKTKEQLIIDKIGIGSTVEYLKYIGRRTINAISFMFLPLTVLYNFFFKEFLVDDLVLYPDYTVFQVEEVPEYKNHSFNLPLDFKPNEDKTSDIVCPFCAKADSVKGDQRIICEHNASSKHTFVVSQEDRNKMFMKLADDDQDPAGLKAVKTLAKDNMPTSAFEHTVNIHYLRGPPGTGKSYLITRMASKYDLIFLPFSKLISDYKSVEIKHKEDVEEGVKENTEFVDYITKTTHRAFNARGCSVIWLDEFTAMDYYMLACVAYLNGTNTIYLVGDEKQTRILPSEGMYIGNMIDLKKVDTHTLIYNFRNAWDVVALMNSKFGYQMIPKSKIKKSILIDDDLDINSSSAPTMHFKETTAQSFGINTNTVRSNQGGTFEEINLVIAGTDDELLTNESLVIVALTRHKNLLRIKTDKSEKAIQFVASLNLTNEFFESLDSHIPDLGDLITPQLTQRTQEEILALVNEFEPTDMLDQVLNNTIISYPNIIKDTISAVFNKSCFSKYAEKSNRCATCLKKFEDENIKSKLCLLCSELPKPMVELVYKYAKLAMQTYKKIKNINMDRESCKLHLYHIMIMVHEMCIFFVTNPECSFETYLFKTGMFTSKEIAYKNIQNMVKQKHPLFIYFIQITKQIKDIIKTLKPLQITRYETFLKTIKPETIMPESINLIFDNFAYIHRVESYKHLSQKYNNIYNEIENSSIISSERAIDNLTKYLLKFKPNDDTLQITDEQQSGDDDQQEQSLEEEKEEEELNVFIYPHSHDFCQCNPFEGSYLCDQENCPKQIPFRGNHICKVIKENTKYYPMPKGNTCLLRAISEILNITAEEVWGALITVIPEANVKAFSEGCSQMDITTLSFIAKALNLTVIVTPESKWNGPLTFGTGGILIYISWTYNDVYDCGHWFASDLNKLNSETSVQFFTTNGVNKLSGSLFISTKASDIVMKPISTIEQAFNGIKNEQEFKQEFEFFLDGPIAPKSFVPVFDIKKLPPIPQPYIQTYSDSHNLIEYNLPRPVFNYNFNSLNKYGVLGIEDNFSNGKFNPNQLLNPVNPRLHPVKQSRTFYTVSSGYGLHYSAVDRFQELQCLQDRYFSKKSKSKFSYLGQKLANEIADLFVDEAFDGNFSAFDDDAAYLVLKEYADACRKKHYPSQIKGIIENTRVRTVRFAMKEIFKPTKLKMELTKAGQGISAWSKDIQVMIGGIIRLVTRHVTSGLKPQYMFNNGMTEEELLDSINGLFKKQNKWCDTAVVDFDRYDATQNRFTQAIEQRILERLGIAPEITAIYYSFRENYSLISQIAKGNGGTTKTSGEPGTLLFNTLLAMALTNWICRGVGPVVIMGQGDDVIKRQLGINKQLAKDRMKLLNNYVKMKMKLDINIELEFCGFSIVRGALIPSLARKAKKITGHRFRDYKHFTEYQISLRDSLALIKRMGLSKVIAENANMFNCNYDTAFWQYSIIQSFAHINEKQFYQRFTKVTIDPVIPIPGKLLH